MPSQTRPSPWDHPRSRGVYGECAGETIACGGSSPLARGLQPERTSRDGHHGIIPARAGFTGSVQEKRSHAADHPRSRGVYRVAAWLQGWGAGSSPLARGLLRPVEGAHVGRGIIPARAGFTRSPRLRRRGFTGSSPLARGLLPRELDRDLALRIIPARAGFTGRAPCEHLGIEDHPRSRGVYEEGVFRALVAVGSSPLARGLRGVFSPWEFWNRIIPARAGFTQ